MNESAPNALVLFDGVCNLCSHSVQFIIRHDPDKHFRFASLQSPVGQEVQQRYHLPPDALDSVLLLENGAVYNRSTAALRIARRLSGVWSLGSIFLVVPRPVRDWAYKLLARNRYRLFGKHELCLLPSPELKDRFLTEIGALDAGNSPLSSEQ